MSECLNELKEILTSEVLINEPLSSHTTMKIGGPADILVTPKSVIEVEQIVKIARKYSIPFRAIGRGSNLLVSDKGIRGIVIKISDGLNALSIKDNKVTVGAGHSFIKLATLVAKEGLSGLEFAGGIPGNVGGAVFMNAGAHKSDVSSVLEKALILFDDGNLEWLSCEDLKFSYRSSILQKVRKGICLDVVFNLQPGNREEIIESMQRNKDYRRETQPWNYPCAGSIFRNPLPNYAGQLVEKAGLKGFNLGGAKVSNIHGNFIVNANHATAKDVLDLIDFIKSTIKQRFDIDLHTEVEIIGEI
ncbi:MAG: UDP-N-acetylenolpyruvoylglucosamine reductase [Bacillales bacterium]|jgi:UDP-N-acetylmuramate dehydrogenase|nr:UDP-N-acetylenolpyruvoylglucosamine reductase [Bacillales bacterium]